MEGELTMATEDVMASVDYVAATIEKSFGVNAWMSIRRERDAARRQTDVMFTVCDRDLHQARAEQRGLMSNARAENERLIKENAELRAELKQPHGEQAEHWRSLSYHWPKPPADGNTSQLADVPGYSPKRVLPCDDGWDD